MAKRVTPLFAVVALGLGGGAASAETKPTAPRTLPSGAPACGNAQTKSPRPCVEPKVAKAEPRTLPTGAPACGNVLAKVDGDKQSIAYLECVAGIDAETSVAGYMLVKKTLVLLGLRAADPIIPVTPRRLRNGSPANGNVQGRMARSEEREERPVEPPRETHHD